MKSHPIEIPLKQYSGGDPRKRAKVGEQNAAATAIKSYLNQEMEKAADPSIRTFESYDISKALHLDVERVCDVLQTLGEHNGITIVRGDYNEAVKARGTPPTDSNWDK